MNLLGRVRIGAPVDARDVEAERLREARLRVARANRLWREVEDDFVRRGPGWLVSAETDEIFTRYRGPVFPRASASVIPDHMPLYWFLDRDGSFVFLEGTGKTWSTVVAKQARRDARRS